MSARTSLELITPYNNSLTKPERILNATDEKIKALAEVTMFVQEQTLTFERNWIWGVTLATSTSLCLMGILSFQAVVALFFISRALSSFCSYKEVAPHVQIDGTQGQSNETFFLIEQNKRYSQLLDPINIRGDLEELFLILETVRANQAAINQVGDDLRFHAYAIDLQLANEFLPIVENAIREMHTNPTAPNFDNFTQFCKDKLHDPSGRETNLNKLFQSIGSKIKTLKEIRG